MSVNANFDSNTTSIKLYVLFIQRTKNTNIYVKLNRLIASNAIFIFELQYRRMTKNTKKKRQKGILYAALNLLRFGYSSLFFLCHHGDTSGSERSY